MGFKKTNYKAKNLGLTIPQAYAQIASLNIDLDGRAGAIFEIQQNRESIKGMSAIACEFVQGKIDKNLPVYKQMYELAKQTVFKDWDDDIVESQGGDDIENN